ELLAAPQCRTAPPGCGAVAGEIVMQLAHCDRMLRVLRQRRFQEVRNALIGFDSGALAAAAWPVAFGSSGHEVVSRAEETVNDLRRRQDGWPDGTSCDVGQSF